MQFDQQRIAVRERSIVEILDLALAVLRERFLPLACCWLVGVAPFALANAYLTHEMLDSMTPDDFDVVLSYIWLTVLLMVFETPLATAAMTIYLGRTMFQEQPRVREVAADFRRALPQLFVYQILLRGLCMPLFVTVAIPYIWFPYLNEIIVLEKNPFQSQTPRGVTTGKRSKAVHGADRGMCIGRWLASLAVGAAMTLLLFWATWSMLSTLAGYWISMRTALLVLWPLALWIVAGYFAVVRFLAYLDLRIRHEGWEVELLMRAEAVRLARQVA